MLNNKNFLSYALVLFMLASSGVVTAGKSKDVKGSKDHSMVSRFKGATIATYKYRDYEEFDAAIGPYEGNGFPTTTLKGRYTHIGYMNPAKVSVAAVYISYTKALHSAGFTDVFKCKARKECGHWFPLYFTRHIGNVYAPDSLNDDSVRYLLSKLSRPEGDVYALLYVYSNTYGSVRTSLVVVESEPLKDNLVKVDADAMAKALADSGRIALYGIYFDTNKSTVKANSKPVLTEIAKLLEKDKKLKLVIVGHTDNKGNMKHNMKLSKSRANSVVNTLVKNHGIKANRLKHWGVGFLSPVATNRTEPGRAKNRRVELVEQ